MSMGYIYVNFLHSIRGCKNNNMYISAWASGVARPDRIGNARAKDCGTSTVQFPTS